jgi:hypothetical protein
MIEICATQHRILVYTAEWILLGAECEEELRGGLRDTSSMRNHV